MRKERKMLKRMAAVCIAGILGWMCGGCTTSAFMPVAGTGVIDPATDGNYRVTGYAHGRYWSTRLFYEVPLGPDYADECGPKLKASAVDGELTSSSAHVENYTINPGAYVLHYGGFLPFILGTECYYVSGTFTEPLPAGE